MENDKEIKVDDNLYSRSILTYGMETMRKLSQLKVFIYGLRGLGIEVAKNIILNGCEEVSIYDSNIVKINDLGSNFYLSEKDVDKKRRDEACLHKLSELNHYVKTSILDLEQKPDINQFIDHFCDKIKKFDVVVITELQTMYFISKLDVFCRNPKNNIKLIYGMCLGLVGYIFVDFGMNHIITDTNGEECGTYLIKSISKDDKGTVVIDNIQGTNNIKFGDGSYVKFKDVGGMTELNDKEFEVRLENFETFRIGDTSKFSEYTKGGVAYQIKKPVLKQYFDFGLRSAIISDPMHRFNIPDYTKTGRPELLYLILTGIHDYFVSHENKLPELNNMEQVKEICEKVKQMYTITKEQQVPWYAEIQEYDERVVLNVVRWCAANLQPVCGFFGGIIAQEIIKATGKYLPIDQWFIQDFLEIAENVKEDADRKLKNCRYDDQIAIFGNEIQDKIKKSNIFMIGAGATGCEFLKNFAMMGFCTDKNAKYVVTDNDNIEISNLTRQFLFKKKDVGKSKALVAIESAKEMNPEFNGEGLQLKVGPETEIIFNEDFWEKQDFIIFAVDSVEARVYLDGKVILHGKPAIDCGTKGIKARSMVIIPKETLTYKDRTPIKKEIQIPNCTLRNFPLSFQHCVEWSKDKFYYYFEDSISMVKLFFSDYNIFKQKILKVGSPMFKLEQMKEKKIFIDMVISKDLKKMCTYALGQFTHNFDHRIQQIIYNYPKDYKDSKGVNFWNNSRRFPNQIKFNSNDELSLEYIYKFIFLLSHALGIEFSKNEFNKENIKKISSEIQIPEFVKQNEMIDTGDEEIDKKEKINLQNKEIENINNEENQKKAQIELDNLIKELDSIQKEKYNPEKINP